MAPQTRSMTKPSPGRCTRNSIYGRSPLPPIKSRKSSTDVPPAETLRAQEKIAQDDSGSKAKKGTLRLACRDEYVIITTVAVSDCGEGVHMRWHYSEDDFDADEEADVRMMTVVDNERYTTPQPSVAAAPGEVNRIPFPKTPMAPQCYDAGSVILTPVKKARPLQRSPPRIGDKGVRCLFEKDGVLRNFNGEAVLRHPVGSSANQWREQVERLENEREERIVHVQVEKLLAERRQVERERFSDSGYEDEMETDNDQSQCHLGKEGSNDTVLISHSDLFDVSQASLEESARVIYRGPSGELLDCHGHRLLGPEGTVLIDPTCASRGRALKEKAFLATTANDEHLHPISATSGLRRPRFGPEGTELID